MKENYYVFLDIDGTMWDIKYVLYSLYFGSYSYLRQPNIQSVDALNLLIKELSKSYNVQIVISSVLRKFCKRDIKLMKEFGLKYNGNIQITPLFCSSRNIAIKKYLLTKENNNNYLIIDDNPFVTLSKKHTNVIKTNFLNGSLSVQNVQDFLAKINVTANVEPTKE